MRAMDTHHGDNDTQLALK